MIFVLHKMAFRFVAADNDKSECLFCFVYLNEWAPPRPRCLDNDQIQKCKSKCLSRIHSVN